VKPLRTLSIATLDSTDKRAEGPRSTVSYRQYASTLSIDPSKNGYTKGSRFQSI